ncbi:hypothetical protein JVU11DRAFT_4055 [Chiua virens]|nr:hypothetical protein JVU11DRAFT_4055 [Chiua virens]
MLSLNGVSAWIEVDGVEIEQYGVEEGQDHITCWIAAQANRSFSIAFKDNAPYRDHSLCSSVTVDGLGVGGKVLYPQLPVMSMQHSPHLVKARTSVQKEQTLSHTSSRPFMFSKLELTDEDEYLYQASTHLGEIRVDVYRAQTFGRRLFRPVPVSESHSKIHERSKKAVTHCVSFGKEVKTAPAYTCSVKYLDGDRQLATFIFKYRDPGLLQANGIIPKPPAANLEVLDLTIDHDVKPKLVSENTERRKALKRSDSSFEGEVRPGKKIKREKKFVPNGEVIDLT